jgi:hypothetical protein
MDLTKNSDFPEVNAMRVKLEKQLDELASENKQDTRKYQRIQRILNNTKIMNYVPASGSSNYSPEEFSKVASEEAPVTLADAYLAGYTAG